MSGVKVRNACLDDSLAVARLISQLGYPTSPAEMKDRLEFFLLDSDYMTLVAESKNKVVGLIGAGIFRYYEKNGTYGRLLALVVDEKQQGRGIGTSLVAEAERRLKEQGVNSIIVNSSKQRIEAHRFYQQLGYEETGLRFVRHLN